MGVKRLLAAAICAAALMQFGCSEGQVSQAPAQDLPDPINRTTIVITHPDIACLIEPLLTEGEELALLAPPASADANTWSPTREEARIVRRALIVVGQGGAAEPWLDTIGVDPNRRLSLENVLGDRGIVTGEITHSHGADGAHSHRTYAPASWLDPAIAMLHFDELRKRIDRSAGADLEQRLTDLADKFEAFAAGEGDTLLVGTAPGHAYIARAIGAAFVEAEEGLNPGVVRIALASHQPDVVVLVGGATDMESITEVPEAVGTRAIRLVETDSACGWLEMLEALSAELAAL